MHFLLSFVPLLSLVHLNVRGLSLPSLLGRADDSDICASIHTDLVVPDFLGISIPVGVIDACLCLSDIPTLLENDPVVFLAKSVAGSQIVTEILTSLIFDGAANSNCIYPQNSTPACVNGNPCGFKCINDFSPFPADNPTKCVCNPPNQVCNDVCVSSKTCPSSTSSRRQVDPWWQQRMSCDWGYTACGTTNSGPYECVDTNSHLENCGGCSVLLNDHSPRGRDCSSIPGVAQVSCHNGNCKVDDCMPGYSVSYDNTTCFDEDQFRLAKNVVQNYRTSSGFI